MGVILCAIGLLLALTGSYHSNTLLIVMSALCLVPGIAIVMSE